MFKPPGSRHFYNTAETSYLKINSAHRETDNINSLIENDEFIFEQSYETLKLWNMDQQKAVLETYETIRKSIFDRQEYLLELYGIQLNEITSRELADLCEFCHIWIMTIKSLIQM
ncbi:MAG: hypothetical protein MZU91_14815 [Desulfosudis oleivorans]|nr:hypothetical protein [Desulfosudis oleivorans]